LSEEKVKGIGGYIVFCFHFIENDNKVFYDAICLSDNRNIIINQIPNHFHGENIVVLFTWCDLLQVFGSREQAIKRAFREEFRFQFTKDLCAEKPNLTFQDIRERTDSRRFVHI